MMDSQEEEKRIYATKQEVFPDKYICTQIIYINLDKFSYNVFHPRINLVTLHMKIVHSTLLNCK